MSTTRRYAGPAELTLRVGANDEPFVRRLFGLLPGSRPAPYLPARVVVDAHVPLNQGSGLSSLAREAGIPFLIDPETHFLQDEQHSDAPWCRTPFGRPASNTPVDLASTSVQDALIQSVVDYQVQYGATMIIAPYVHIETPDSRWPEIQAGLWRGTRDYVVRAGLNLPVIAVVAVGWRCLHPREYAKLEPIWDALADLDPDEIALAASKVHMGAKPEDRIAELLMVVRNLARDYKVTMWQQGLLGDLCIVEGAAGYECGIGWREKCDLQSRKAVHREPASDRGRTPRPVVIRELGRAIPRVRLELARTKRRTWSKLVCPFPDCCAPGGHDLLGDARRHSVISRVRELEQLDATRATSWRWNHLTQRARDGLALAHELNALAPSSSSTPAIDIKLLAAIHTVAKARRGRRVIVRRTA